MSGGIKVGSEPFPEIPKELHPWQEGTADLGKKFSGEILTSLWSFLDDASAAKVSCISTSVFRHVHIYSKMMIRFIDQITSKLDPKIHNGAISKLNNIKQQSKLVDKHSVPSQNRIEGVKNEIIEILTSLDPSLINQLQEIQPPTFFGPSLVEFVKIKREWKSNKGSILRDYYLRDKIETNQGNNQLSRFVLGLMKNLRIRFMCALEHGDILVAKETLRNLQQDSVDRGVPHFKYLENQQIYLVEYADKCCEFGELKEALAVIDSIETMSQIQKVKHKLQCLETVLENNKRENASACVEEMEDSIFKAECCLKLGNLKKAKNVLLKLPKIKNQDHALYNCCEILLGDIRYISGFIEDRRCKLEATKLQKLLYLNAWINIEDDRIRASLMTKYMDKIYDMDFFMGFLREVPMSEKKVIAFIDLRLFDVAIMLANSFPEEDPNFIQSKLLCKCVVPYYEYLIRRGSPEAEKIARELLNTIKHEGIRNLEKKDLENRINSDETNDQTIYESFPIIYS
ncbi:MAG: hypothetical protein S4CHLAM20_01220 [Chlamydiia bacterium]|nr:hypothetical protein [Chlamydiia bacterium]